jgi:hypothetical protein
METKKCPYCGEEILSVAIKCKHCKSNIIADSSTIEESVNEKVEKKINKIEKLRKCPSCGAMVPVIAITCRNCGHEVKTEDELLPKTDLLGPILGVALIIAFFLDWFVEKSNYKPYHFNGMDLFGSRVEHPKIIPVLALIFIIIMIFLFLSHRAGEKELYRIRGFAAIGAGMISFLYCLFILYFSDIAKYKSWDYGIGFYVTLICGVILVVSGLISSFYYFSLYKKEIKKIYGIDIKY